MTNHNLSIYIAYFEFPIFSARLNPNLYIHRKKNNSNGLEIIGLNLWKQPVVTSTNSTKVVIFFTLRES